MNHVQAFITNISFPTSLDELFDFGIRFDIEQILGVMSVSEEDNELYCENEGWTVPRWAKTDDIVFFFHAKTANARISRLMTELDNIDVDFEEKQVWYMRNSLNRAKAIWSVYGGTIFAIGRVSGSIFSLSPASKAHWGSSIYAPIDSIFLLDKPIHISEFNSQITVSRQSAITPIFGTDFDYLKTLIIKKNKHIWKYFLESVSQPIPLSKMTKENWLTVANPYRRRFILEIQFRVYYVNYLLPLLGDRKGFYKECKCVKRGCNPTWVDNIIHINEQYLAIEVKLNINLEKNLTGQCDQYMNIDEVELSKEIIIKGNELLPYVLVIDTDSIYIYDGTLISTVYELDKLNSIEDIFALKEIVRQLVSR